MKDSMIEFIGSFFNTSVFLLIVFFGIILNVKLASMPYLKSLLNIQKRQNG